ncbi:HlyD family secretion protein [Sphingomonas sp. CJ20]
MKLFRDEVIQHRQQRLYGEVVLSQPVSTRLVVMGLACSVAILVAWLLLSTYTRIEAVRGILVTDRPSAKVLAPVPGVVAQLRVREGTLVRKGDPLAVISIDRQAASGHEVVADSLGTIEVRRSLADEQIELAYAKEVSDRAALAENIKVAAVELASLRSQLALQKEMVASNQRLFDQSTILVERAVISRVDYERKRQALIASRQQLESLDQQAVSKAAEHRQLSSQLKGITNEVRRQIVDLKVGREALAQQKAQLEGQQAYIVTAPVSGRVTALQAAEGRIASSNSPMMVILPEGAKLKAELYAPSRAVGFVRPGQETRLLYDAFPYQRFGSYAGRVQSISGTIIDPRETDVPLKLEEPAYRVLVSLDDEPAGNGGASLTLQPGMTLQANIVLERQSFLQWLLRPLHAIRNRSG